MQFLPEIEGIAVTLGGKRYFFRATETPFNNSCSATIIGDKYSTSKLLEKAGVPVPKAVELHVSEFEKGILEERIKSLRFPLVAKPAMNSSRGDDVLCNIKNLVELKAYLSKLFTFHAFVQIEEFHANLQSYRVLVLRRRVIGIVRRYPAQVIGDGKHTIEELIKLTNEQRKRTDDALGPIVIDEECQIRLKELRLKLRDVPAQDEVIPLGYTSNATRGGSFESVETRICKANRRLMKRIMSLLNLGIAGIDIECADLNQPLAASGGVIIEINNRPSIRIHEKPIFGKPNRVTKTIMRSLIFRHPVAYLAVLYTNRKAFFYLRSLILIIFLSLLYKLFL